MKEKALRDLASIWMDRLGLSHWTIEIAVEKLEPRTTSMQTSKSPHYDRGRIIVQPWVIAGEPPADWFKAPHASFEQAIEETIVHELLHLLLWETSSAICLLSAFHERLHSSLPVDRAQCASSDAACNSREDSGAYDRPVRAVQDRRCDRPLLRAQSNLIRYTTGSVEGNALACDATSRHSRVEQPLDGAARFAYDRLCGNHHTCLG